MLLMPLMRSTP